jgi:inosine/xanthosine triphosphatase
MAKIHIAVGTMRRPKLNAVWEALTVFGPSLDPDAQFEVVGVEVPSTVGHTPLSRGELMAGARARAEALVRLARERPAERDWRYFVGLEGGLDMVEEDGARRPSALAQGSERKSSRAFLQSWAYVTDGAGRSAYGQSGAIEVPATLVRRVVEEGVELGQAIDEFAGGHGIRDVQGAWGVLSGNLITRQDAFRVAVISAFAPFFNAEVYRSG